MSNLPALIEQQKDQFEKAGNANFEAEKGFAIQAFTANNFLANVASRDPQSAMAAVVNVSALGVSLNPASKEAYLVPRGGKVVLDISYRGLINLAIRGGGIRWADCKLVHEKDAFVVNGVDEKPTHSFNPFGDRGAIVGGYAVCKTNDGSFLTCTMNIAEINKVKQCSESVKRGSKSPWTEWPEEMMRKTILKRAVKTWPQCDAMNKAIEYLNTEAGEGINFANEQRSDAMIEVKQMDSIIEHLNRLEKDTGAFLAYFSRSVLRREVSDLSDLTRSDAEKAINMLSKMGR